MYGGSFCGIFISFRNVLLALLVEKKGGEG